jgi:hypothetical protein
MLRTLLAQSKDVDIADEIHFFAPRWLRVDIATRIRRHVGSLDGPDAIDRLLELFYTPITVSWFWQTVDQQLDREMLRNELAGRNLSLQSIFDAILVVHARMRGKPRVGAKFPMHYSFTDRLIQWYPDCLLLHTTRDPRAVYSSQAQKYISDDLNWVRRQFTRFLQFVHINLQIARTARLHNRLQGRSNYRLVRYEDMVSHPESEIRDICNFLDIEFVPEMLSPKRFGSSYEKPGQVSRGISPSSLERWRTSISGFSARFIEIVHRRSMRSLGYST